MSQRGRSDVTVVDVSGRYELQLRHPSNSNTERKDCLAAGGLQLTAAQLWHCAMQLYEGGMLLADIDAGITQASLPPLELFSSKSERGFVSLPYFQRSCRFENICCRGGGIASRAFRSGRIVLTCGSQRRRTQRSHDRDVLSREFEATVLDK